MVMEVANAGDWATYIEKSIYSGPNEKEVQAMFRKLAQGLSKIHAAGVAVRDIKPENILLFRNKDGLTAKYADFGLSSLLSEPFEKACGSPYFLPIEAYTGNEYDLKSGDWFALGLSLFQALSPKFPLIREEINVLSDPKWPYGWYISAPDLNGYAFTQLAKNYPDAADLLKNMLAKEATDRWAGDQVTGHKWLK
jgi:serine/threonine protein kinase